MADDAGLLETLWRYVQWAMSPQAAEAKIVGDPRAMAVLDALRQSQEQGYLPETYRQIVSRAQADPQTVHVEAEAPATPGGVAAYDYARPGVGHVISYNPLLDPPEMPNVLTHELLHFLNQVSALPLSTETQHDIIKTILGTDVHTPARLLKGYEPPATADPAHR